MIYDTYIYMYQNIIEFLLRSIDDNIIIIFMNFNNCIVLFIHRHMKKKFIQYTCNTFKIKNVIGIIILLIITT